MRTSHRHRKSIVATLAMMFSAAGSVAADGPAIGTSASEEVVWTADEQASAESWERFAAASAKSSDLRMRVIFATDGFEERSGLDYPRERIPLESLVDQARGSTDPLVLAMLVGLCGRAPAKARRCDALDFARRWTVADTQNQLAWVVLAGHLQQRGDRDGARAAFARAGQASMWHQSYDDVKSVIARALPRTLTPRERLFGLYQGLGVAAAHTISIVPYSYLRAACKDPSTRDTCAHILETMFRDDNTLFGIGISWRFAQDAGISPEVTKARKRRYDATWWAVTKFLPPDGAELDDPAMLAKAVDVAEQRIKLGDMGWGQRLLQQSGVSESDAAARYLATLPPGSHQ